MDNFNKVGKFNIPAVLQLYEVSTFPHCWKFYARIKTSMTKLIEGEISIDAAPTRQHAIRQAVLLCVDSGILIIKVY